MTWRNSAALLCLSALSTLMASAPHAQAKATFVLKNVDAAGIGFNDPTPATPVGGNTGTTVGQQRLNAFQYALNLWGKAIDSAVPIVVEASFEPLECANGFAPLGQAAATGVEYDAPGLEANVLYPEALADRLAGYDLNPDEADIKAQFNSSISECLLGLDWYYGLDGQAGDNFDLASVVLHEIGHGLGFSYLPDPTTGDLFWMNMPDPYTRHLLDNSTGRHFDVMTATERLASISNVRHIVWDGQYATQAAASYLATGGPNLTVSPSISGFFGALLEVNYGPRLPSQPITGPLAIGNPLDGCASLTSMTGSIALLYEGDCSEMNMSQRAEVAGAKAVVFAGEDTITPPRGSLEYAAKYLNVMTWAIPTVQLSRTEADRLRAASGENITLVANTAQRVGADTSGRVYMYASVPTVGQSSISHWDPLARPNLLLEPTATIEHSQNLTVEQGLLRDIGWEPFCGDGKLEPGEECDSGSANSDTVANACRTTCTRAKCGDSVVDTGEQCDSGSSNSDTTPDACRTTCVKPKCGDSVVDTGEQCDHGADNGDAGVCSLDCKLPTTLPGSTEPAAAAKDSGCTCRVQSIRSGNHWLLMTAGVLLLGLRRRKRV
jgi:hypothetical protein